MTTRQTNMYENTKSYFIRDDDIFNGNAIKDDVGNRYFNGRIESPVDYKNYEAVKAHYNIPD